MQMTVTSFGDLKLCYLITSFLYLRLKCLCLGLIASRKWVCAQTEKHPNRGMQQISEITK